MRTTRKNSRYTANAAAGRYTSTAKGERSRVGRTKVDRHPIRPRIESSSHTNDRPTPLQRRNVQKERANETHSEDHSPSLQTRRRHHQHVDASIRAKHGPNIRAHNGIALAPVEGKSRMARRDEMRLQSSCGGGGEPCRGGHSRANTDAVAEQHRANEGTGHSTATVDKCFQTCGPGAHVPGTSLALPNSTAREHGGSEVEPARLEIGSTRQTTLLQNDNNAGSSSTPNNARRICPVSRSVSTHDKDGANCPLHSARGGHCTIEHGRGTGIHCDPDATRDAGRSDSSSGVHGTITGEQGSSETNVPIFRIAKNGHVIQEILELWNRIAQQKDDKSGEEDDCEIDILPWSSETFRIRVRKGTQMAFPHHTQPCKYPLGTTVCATLNVDRIRRETANDTELAHLLDNWITDAHIAPMLEQLAIQSRREHATPKVSRHFGSEDQPILDMICEAGHVGDWIHPAFKVAKKDHTSRFIHNLCDMSQRLRALGVKTPPMGLPQLPTVLDRIVDYNCIATVDATSFFFQIPIHVKLRKYFGVLVASKRGNFCRRRLRVLPMGLSHSPAIAQHLAMFFTNKISEQFQHAFATVWVDNFILCARSHEQLAEMRAFTDQLFREYGLHTKAWETGTRIEVLGFYVSETPQGLSVELKDHGIFATTALPTTMQPLDVLCFAGKIIFANYALIRRPLAFLPSLLQAVRTASTNLFHQNGLPIDVPPTLAHEIQTLERWWNTSPVLTRTNKMHHVPVTNQSWSDASTHTIAVVHEYELRDEIAHITHTQLSPKNVYLLELLAILFAARTTTLPREIVTDSQIAAKALIKGHTHSTLGNELIAHILQEDVFKSVLWVDTTSQRADPITRGQQIPLPRIVRTKAGDALLWKVRSQG